MEKGLDSTGIGKDIAYLMGRSFTVKIISKLT